MCRAFIAIAIRIVEFAKFKYQGKPLNLFSLVGRVHRVVTTPHTHRPPLQLHHSRPPRTSILCWTVWEYNITHFTGVMSVRSSTACVRTAPAPLELSSRGMLVEWLLGSTSPAAASSKSHSYRPWPPKGLTGLRPRGTTTGR
ncbi:hypothetical protein FHG87_000481 [Trinorchestia longiramus]|nr:hypothetical protein FHG87_000481 [Trinorchestia longiramus]